LKKIPTLFDRDWTGDRSRVVNAVHKDCGWVVAGEGIATRKIDGTSCLVRGGRLYKRRELRKGDTTPPLFETVGHDDETGKTVGWMPIEPADSGDRYHVEAFGDGAGFADGTYELVGPKVQGNPEGYKAHTLVPHSALELANQPPRDFDGLREWLEGKDIEGIVWHHPDGRMAKIKLRDFGHKRSK
jgi:hypothetical protein